jgi:iron(III) transport system permease protein
LLNSAILAAGATAIAIPLGTLLAAILSRFAIPGRRVAVACLGLLLFLPLFIQLSGWDAMLGIQGWQTLVFGSVAEPVFRGMRGAIVVHALAAVPWVALIAGIGLAQVDPGQEEAALLDAPPLVVLWRITLPQIAPFLVAAGVWTVVSTTAEMTVTNIYLVPTYTEEFYNTFSLSADAGEAAVSVLPGVASLAVLIVAVLAIFTRLPLIGLRFAGRQRVEWPLQAAYWPLVLAIWLIIALLVAVPLGSLIYKAGFEVTEIAGTRVRSWSASKLAGVLMAVPRDFKREFAWTGATALGAASLATVVALIVGWTARRGRAQAAIALAIVVLGLVVPGPLIGVALIGLLNHDLPALIWLYDRTAFAPIVAQAIRALPLSILLCWHSFATLDDDVLSAAALDGVKPRQMLWRIALPQRWPAVLAAWLAAFAIAAGDLAWSLLVLPPGMDTVQRRVFGLVHSGVEEQVAGISLVMVAAYAILAVLILRLVRPKSQPFHLP